MSEEKVTKKKFKIGNLVFWIVLLVVALYSVLALTSENNGELRSVFGRTALTVQTDSMAPEFYAGDLIYVDTEFEASEIEVGDVITYFTLLDVNGDDELEGVFNSHRVIHIEQTLAGDYKFTTQGDANTSADAESIVEGNVVAVWTGDVSSNWGGIIDGIVGFLKSGAGFFIFIVIPCFAFLVYEIYRFTKVMAEYRLEQAQEGKDKLREEAIAIAKKQLEEEAKQKALEEETKKEE